MLSSPDLRSVTIGKRNIRYKKGTPFEVVVYTTDDKVRFTWRSDDVFKTFEVYCTLELSPNEDCQLICRELNNPIIAQRSF